MKRSTLASLVAAITVSFLVGCASSPSATGEKPKTVELSVLMEQAAAAEKAETKQAALAKYEEAAKSYPASKAPWARIAQIQYDSGNYGEAIVAAQQVVSRDDKDKVAHSILSVSGLRVSSKALADLSRQNELNGSVRNEAQNLTKVLRESLGEQTLVPAAPRLPPPPRPVAAKPTPSAPPAVKPTTTSPPAPASGGSGNPFGALK